MPVEGEVEVGLENKGISESGEGSRWPAVNQSSNLWPFFSSVQFSRSVVSDSLGPHESQHARPPSIANSRSLLKLMSIELVMPSSHLILCHPLLLLPPIPPSIRVFSNESNLCIRWPKYWSFSVNISLSNEHTGLNSLRMDWLDSLQYKGLSRVFSNTTVQKHQFFGTQFSLLSSSHIHMTTGKTIALTRRTFVGKIMSCF